MKKIIILLSVILCLCMLVGCMGTPVIYGPDCTCETEGDVTPAPTPDASVPEGGLKTGLALVAAMDGGNTKSATAEAVGAAAYDVTMVAVLVDANGVIRDCIIDSLGASLQFDTAGQIVSDIKAVPQTKNELGENYGMMPAGTWESQAKALADFAVGKTVGELKNGAIDETGRAPAGSDLASSATIYLGGYVSAIEKAAANATYLGASSGDELRLAAMPSFKSSTAGNSQLDVDATALTLKDGKITSSVIDSVQAKVAFDGTGVITSDISGAFQTKNELGAAYNMVLYGGAIAEWNEQAASFAKYIVGKTPAEVSGIAVDEGTKPTEADLTSSVTIAIGGFQALIQKAAQ